MKIIVVSQYYWPDNFLINEIAEELITRGHEVIVLTGLPDYATNHIPKEYKHGKNRHEIRNGVEIFRVPIIARHTGFVFRVFNYLSFFINSSLFAKFHKFDADVVMAYQTAPVLMANAAIVLKNKMKKPLFFYCLDIWPDQMKVWGVYEKNPLFRIMKKYCKYAYGEADLLGISSMPFKRYMVNVNKVEENKIVYLPQHSSKMKIKTEKNVNDEVNLIFAGNIGQQQNVECILEAVAKVKTDKKYKIHIYGDGSSFEKCKNLAENKQILDRVIFYGRVPKEQLYEVYSKMDAFLLTLCSEKDIGFVANTVPAKFQGYISTGKPILATIDGGAREIIEKTKCGLVVAAGDINGFAEIIKEYVENPQKYIEYGNRGKKYFDENYDKKVVIDKLEGYLRDLTDEK